MWPAEGGLRVAEVGLEDWAKAAREFLETGGERLLLVFGGDPKSYLDRLEGEGWEAVVYKRGGALERLMGTLYLYVYGLDGTPVFPCSAMLLSRRACELALQLGGRGLTPLIRAVRTLEARGGGVKYVAVQGAPGFPLSAFLSKVILPAILDSPLLRFVLVGASGILVNLGVLEAQVRLLGLYSKSYLGVPLAFETSVAWNFLLNNRYTFRAREIRKLRFLEYNASTLGSFLLQLTCVYFLTAQAHLHHLLADLVGILLGFLANYTLSLLIWRRPWPRLV